MSTGIIDLFVFVLVIEVLAFAALPFTAWMLPQAVDRGYGLSKIVGVFLFGLLSWVFPALGIAPATEGFSRLIFTVVIVAGYVGYTRALLSINDCRRLVRTQGLYVEGLFIGVTVILAAIRFFNPEINWGEKPMDSTFLHFLVRTDTLPPQDPWAAGHIMRYYYVGIYFIAELLELTGIPVSIGYNIAMSALGGFIASALYTLFALLTRSLSFSAVAAILVVFASNPEVLNICALGKKAASFDTFWASARLFTSPCFFEYTAWSLLFADLHAHVIAIPFTILALTLAASLFGDSSSRYTIHGFALRLLLGATLAVLFASNTWDFITYGAVCGAMVVLAQVPSFWKPPVGSDGRVRLAEKLFAVGFARTCALVWDAVVCLASAVPLYWLYSHASGAKRGIGVGFVTVAEFNTFSQVFRALGYPMIAGCIGLLTLIGLRIVQRERVTKRAGVGALFALSVLGYAIIASGRHLQWELPWGIILYSLVTCTVLWLALWGSRFGWQVKAAALMGTGAACLITYCEVFYLIDRMNTVFKGYMAVWMFTSVASLTIAYYAYSGVFKSRQVVLSRVIASMLIVLGFLTTYGTVLNAKGVIKMQRIPKRTYTLDGARFLEDSSPDEAKLIRWLNESVSGAPTMLEAHGPSYREFTRIAMFTGIPTVLGWDYHVLQRGLPSEEIERRRSDVKTIYSTPDARVASAILRRNLVDLIVVSDVERANYDSLALSKFDLHPELFIPLFSSGNSKVYATSFSPLSALGKE